MKNEENRFMDYVVNGLGASAGEEKKELIVSKEVELEAQLIMDSLLKENVGREIDRMLQETRYEEISKIKKFVFS